MFRALFLGIGLSLVILGAECLILERVVLADRPKSQETAPAMFTFANEPPRQTRVINPPDWAPWSFIGSGVLVILYSFTIPKRVAG